MQASRLDFWVTGWGTGGTLTGAGEMIKKARPGVQVIVAAEPAGAALLSGAEFKPHKIQGWTPDFVPAVLNRSVPDEILAVTDDEAIQAARSLCFKGRNFLRDLLRRDIRSCLESGPEGTPRLRDSRDASGYRGALPYDCTVRGYRGRV